MEEAFKSLALTLAKVGAPVLGTALGGPAGGAVASIVVGALAEALGTVPTPDAVEKAITERPEGKIIAKQVEAAQAPAVMEEVNAYLKDVQDARAATANLVEKGSVIAWGAPLVSVIVMIGFGILSYLAIYAPANQREVLLFLLGNWSIMAGSVCSYWLGSSAGSASKEAVLTNLAKRR